MKIGFIGLGIMGKPMAKNLLAAGHQWWSVPTTRRRQRNCPPRAPPPRITETDRRTGGAVFTMLPNSPDVKAVALGAEGIIEGPIRGWYSST